MEKDIDRIAKNPDTDIVIRIDDFGGKRGVTIREFVKGERYTGFTKAGTRIPADKFKIFKEAINSIDDADLVEESGEQDTLNEDSHSEDDSSGDMDDASNGDDDSESDTKSDSDNIEEQAM